MNQYRTARVICTYKCHRSCAGCVNTVHPAESVQSVSKNEFPYGYNEIILTGGEPTLFPYKLKEIANDLKYTRLILYTAAPDYMQVLMVMSYFSGITITLHDDYDVSRFNACFPGLIRWGERHNGNLPLFFIRMYDNIQSTVQLFPEAQYKVCRWVPPEECKLQPNEDLYRLPELWE